MLSWPKVHRDAKEMLTILFDSFYILLQVEQKERKILCCYIKDSNFGRCFYEIFLKTFNTNLECSWIVTGMCLSSLCWEIQQILWIKLGPKRNWRNWNDGFVESHNMTFKMDECEVL